MRIVHVEDFFHPDAGYQINILSKYLVQFGHDVTLVTSAMEKIPKNLTAFFGIADLNKRDTEYTNNTGVKVIRLPIRAFVSGRAIFGKNLHCTVDQLAPDVLFAHGNDTLSSISFIRRLDKLPYALITDSHMLEMASTNRFNWLFRLWYRQFITPKLLKHNVTVIRTQDDTYVEKNLGIPLTHAPWISYGADTLMFHPDDEIKRKFRKHNCIGNNDFVVVFTGKLDESKGGMLLAETFLKRFSVKKNIVLIVVGNATGEYGTEVEKIFELSENRIIRFPTQKYLNLAQFYQASDLAVFAKQCSLSFYDAQACGLPVLSENNNINVNRCSHGNGWNFKAEDVNDFRRMIERIASIPFYEYEEVSRRALRFILDYYDYHDKAKEYEKEIQQAYIDFSNRGVK